MQLKKSPSANLENKRLTYVLVGLVFALSVLYVAFEWTESDIVVAEITDQAVETFEDEMIDNTTQEDETPPPPEPEELPEEITDEFTVVEDDKKVDAVEFKSEDDQNSKVEIHQAPVVVVEVEEEEEDKIFDVVEENPEFPGGMSALNKYFRENVKYPVMAQEMNIQGKVLVKFTVWKDGSIRDAQIVRSADKSLDQEALRLVSRMPKWKPGKQRGKPVNCKFTVPVTFKLQQ